MQDVTTRRFFQLISGTKFGAPDLFVTEFLRVHSTSEIDAEIADSLENSPAGTPIFLQLIGEDVPALEKISKLALSKFKNLAGIDLNLGCPAPKICRKNVGGGLLKNLEKVAEIVPALRKITADFGKKFSVKCRLGFENSASFPRLLEIFNENSVDFLSVHGRTVRGLYREKVDYDAIAFAAKNSKCAVFANGEISSVEKAKNVFEKTGVFGFMIGRHAIRNPWIFRQIHEARERHFFEKNAAGTPDLEIFRPRLSDVFFYIRELENCVKIAGDSRERVAARMKKFLNFVGTSVDPAGAFLFEIRRAQTPEEIFSISEKFLLTGTRGEEFFSLEPFSGIVARPNCEI